MKKKLLLISIIICAALFITFPSDAAGSKAPPSKVNYEGYTLNRTSYTKDGVTTYYYNAYGGSYSGEGGVIEFPSEYQETPVVRIYGFNNIHI